MSPHPSSPITVTVEGAVMIITMDRPEKKNAFNDAQYTDMAQALTTAEGDEDILVVVITGRGDYFSSGADISEPPELTEDRRSIEEPVGQFMMKVIQFPKPLIAAVNGPAVGVGVTLLPHCDIVIASSTATFWTPFARICVVPEFCSSKTFPDILGRSLASDMLLNGRKLCVQTALQHSLISHIVPAGPRFLQEALDLVRPMTTNPLAETTLPLFKGMVMDNYRGDLEVLCRRELGELDKRLHAGDTATAVIMLMSQRSKL